MYMVLVSNVIHYGSIYGCKDILDKLESRRFLYEDLKKVKGSGEQAQ